MREMKGGVDAAPPAPGGPHAGQFFLDEALLCDRVADFLNQGLLAGDALVVIATPAHRQTLTAALTTAARPTDRAAGFDIADLCARRQLILLDAEEMLAKFMVGDSPDWDRFQHVMEEVLDRGDRSRQGQRLRVYGEMVDVLWKSGNPQAAIRLEEMWNDLVRGHPLELLYAYAMGSFYMSPVDAEGMATKPPADEGLERTTRELTAEISARKKLEVEMRRFIRDRRRTEHEARAAAARMAELQNATARMATALDVVAVGEILLSVSERVLGARAGVFYLPDEQGRYCLQATQGLPEAVKEWSVLPLDSSLPLATAITSAAPVWIEEYPVRLPVQRKGNATPPQAGPTGDHKGGDLQAVVAMPILQGTRVLGGFGLSFGAARKFEEGERRWLESFASQCGLAIERARLYEGEQRARAEAETLFRIAASLNSTQLDRAAIVQCVTDQATAMVGAEVGAFFYNAPNQEGGAELLYTMSGAPAEAFARFGLPRNAPLFNASAGLGAGEGGIRLDDVTKDPRYGQWRAPPGARPGQLPITSYLAAPLTSRDGTVMGALVFGHSQPGRFTAHHERMLKTLAITAAVSMENANLFSATREADEKHRRSIADLTETVRMNELFAGVLAHDLRNPLASIMTAAQVTLGRTADERLTKPMNRILKSGERMLRMIEQLLDFTRIRVGNGMPINSRELDLVPLLRQVADELKAGAADARITIQGTGDTNGGWDGDRLAQVFSNLLGNALHHGQPDRDGNSAVTVDVQVDGRDGDRVQVLVHNAGTIPAGTGPNLFEPFGSRDRHAERTRGLGLGLFITREIVRAHGGSVRVESSESAGTTFSVSLPRFALVVQPPADLPQSRSLQEAQEQLRGSEERIRMLVETVRDYAIFMLDPTGRVQTWNAGAERIKGYRASEIIGQHFSIFYDPELIRAGVCQRELEVAARDGRFEEEGWRLRKDGARFWASVVITALRHPRGELLGFAKVVRDLTDRRKAEAERIRLAHAQESIRLRDEFLSIVSHELKTPLAGLQLQLENLQRRLDMSDQMTATQLRRATESGQRLASLIESLLDASRIATGRLVLAPQRFDLAEAIRQVIAAVEPPATKAGCTLMTRLESPVQGTWDRDRIQQAVTNLLSNAIKYAAGSEIEISLSRTPSGGEEGSNSDEVIVQVTDHGPGVPVEDLARIFGRFERAVPIQHHGGLGLGLYVVGEIASAHGGSVTAENLPQGGARFVLRLPLHLPVPAPLLGPHAQTVSRALRRGSN